MRGVLIAAALALSAAAGAAPAHKMDRGTGVVGMDVSASGPVVDLLLAVDAPAGLSLVHRRSMDGGWSWGADNVVPTSSKVHPPHRGNDPQVAASGAHVVVVWSRPGTSKWGNARGPPIDRGSLQLRPGPSAP